MTTRNPTEVDAARALNSGAIHLLRAMRVVDRRSGLTPARLSALSVLVFGGPCSLGRLASAEDVAGPTMTRIVDGLERLGLAVRRPHPDSARSIQVAATVAGEELMQRAAEARIEAIITGLRALEPVDRAALLAAAGALPRLATLVRTSEPIDAEPTAD